mmetsp:Transcript_28520/g.83942  ORF Transcript_28520/g.83942 Transcript_28520/m.83942 type:complete len:334 (+) Transcript_28520:730-1731(+)
MIVHPRIPPAFDVQTDPGLLRQRREKIVERTDARLDRNPPPRSIGATTAAAVQPQFYRDGRLPGRTGEFGRTGQLQSGRVRGGFDAPHGFEGRSSSRRVAIPAAAAAAARVGPVQQIPQRPTERLERALHDVMSVIAPHFFEGDDQTGRRRQLLEEFTEGRRAHAPYAGAAARGGIDPVRGEGEFDQFARPRSGSGSGGGGSGGSGDGQDAFDQRLVEGTAESARSEEDGSVAFRRRRRRLHRLGVDQCREFRSQRSSHLGHQFRLILGRFRESILVRQVRLLRFRLFRRRRRLLRRSTTKKHDGRAHAHLRVRIELIDHVIEESDSGSDGVI